MQKLVELVCFKRFLYEMPDDDDDGDDDDDDAM